jgi:hypothetical protein
MRIGKQTSTSAIMTVIGLVALQMALFQDVWFIVLFPPVTIAVLALNLGLFFLLVGPNFLKSRIMGMLLASVAISLGISVFAGLNTSNPAKPGVWRESIQQACASWADTLGNPTGPTASFLRFLSVNSILIEFLVLDLLGVATIYFGGWMEHRLHRAEAKTAPPSPPLDERAATPL